MYKPQSQARIVANQVERNGRHAKKMEIQNSEGAKPKVARGSARKLARAGMKQGEGYGLGKPAIESSPIRTALENIKVQVKKITQGHITLGAIIHDAISGKAGTRPLKDNHSLSFKTYQELKNKGILA